MSIYSNMYDFGDVWEEYGDEFMSKADVFIDNNIAPLRISGRAEALPYFPFLVATKGTDSEKAYVRLSTRSAVDLEEERYLNGILEKSKKYYRKCKRKKEKFDVNEALKIAAGGDVNYLPIIESVSSDGEKATMPNNVHSERHDEARSELCGAMVKAGYSLMSAITWCFGLGRFLRNELPNGLKRS